MRTCRTSGCKKLGGSSFVEIFSHISSTERQLQNHLFLISSSKWHVLRKWPFSPSLSKIKFCQNTLLFLSQKNKFPVKICLSFPPKKTTCSGYNANHPCGNKSRPQVFNSKSFGAVKLRLVFAQRWRRSYCWDGEVRQKANRKVGGKRIQTALTKVILNSEGFGACWEHQGCELLGVLGSDRAGHGGDCQGGDQVVVLSTWL